MQIRKLLADDQAVSPVIGVILMVAITVILAAVIGTFVLGLGDQVSSSTPQVSWAFEYDDSLDGSGSDCAQTLGSDGQLNVTHDGGDKIAASTLEITDGSTTAELTGSSCSGVPTDLTAGNEFTAGVDSADVVRIVWENPNGGDTNTLGKWTGPDA